MKRLIKLKVFKGFTLIELLVVISIIVVLVGYYIAHRPNAQIQSDTLETRQLLTNISQAIQSFQSDWGELPPQLGVLISDVMISSYAQSKGVKNFKKKYMEYPFKTFKRFKSLYRCPMYRDYAPPPTRPWELGNRHFVDQTAPTVQCVVWWPVGTDRCPELCSVCTTFTENAATEMVYLDRLPFVDKWDNPLFFKLNNRGGYFLMSAGPDGQASPNYSEFVNSASYPDGYSQNSSSLNKDNIVYGTW